MNIYAPAPSSLSMSRLVETINERVQNRKKIKPEFEDHRPVIKLPPIASSSRSLVAPTENPKPPEYTRYCKQNLRIEIAQTCARENTPASSVATKQSEVSGTIRFHHRLPGENLHPPDQSEFRSRFIRDSTLDLVNMVYDANRPEFTNLSSMVEFPPIEVTTNPRNKSKQRKAKSSTKSHASSGKSSKPVKKKRPKPPTSSKTFVHKHTAEIEHAQEEEEIMYHHKHFDSDDFVHTEVRKSEPDRVKIDKNIHQKVYVCALSDAKAQAMFEKSPARISSFATTRPFVFSYFGRGDDDMEASYVHSKRKKRKDNPMKAIFGNINLNEYYPGGAKYAVRPIRV